MININEAIDKIQDFLEEDKRRTIIICLCLILMCLCAVLALCLSSSGTKNKSKVEEKKLILDQPLLVPDGPSIPDGYITSRKTEKNWSEEEIEKWFTLPDEGEVEKLGDTNDRIVQDIIGAAP